jgi:hypothetical protein
MGELLEGIWYGVSLSVGAFCLWTGLGYDIGWWGFGVGWGFGALGLWMAEVKRR